MERVSQNEYVWPPLNNENMYESLRQNEYDYIQRPPLPLPRFEASNSPWYDQACDQTKPKQCDNTEVKQVVDSESDETLNDKTGHAIMTKKRICSQSKRFVHGESLQPTDDDHGPHVWEPLCYPSGYHDVPKDTDSLVQWFNNSSDSYRENFAIAITSCVIPQYYKDDNTIGLAKLLHCKCNKIQILALNRIADLLFFHRISSCSGYQLLSCTEFVWGALKNNRSPYFIRHLSYVMVLLLSTVYLWGISNPEKWDKEAFNVKATLKLYISEFPDQRLCSSLDESSKSLLWALECFMHCLEANCLRPSIFQIGEWEQSMLLEENRSIIERKVVKMVYSELIVLSVLLLNLLNRVPESSLHISTLLQKSTTHLLQSTKCKLCSLNLKQRLTGQNYKYYQQRRGHLSANVVATGLIRAIQSMNSSVEASTFMLRMPFNQNTLMQVKSLWAITKMTDTAIWKRRIYVQMQGYLNRVLLYGTAVRRSLRKKIDSKETHTVMKNIIERCVVASSLTKQMLLTELEKLCFSKHYFVRLCGVELLGVEGSNVEICRGYITRSLSLARLSLMEDVSRKSSDVGHPFWKVMFGNFGDIRVKINCLIPSKHCVIKLFSEDYTSKADRNQTADNWNTFVTLKNLQCCCGHDNIVKLLAYQYFPLPVFFILEHQPNKNFLEWLLSHRNDNTWMRSETLIFMIKDIVSAVKFLHKNNILHRDLTACRCVISDESFSVKLHQFRLAKKRNVKGNESRFSTRWMAPESMRNGKFSLQTDVWMVGLFIWEVLTHGCWPFTEHSDKTTDMIMELVVYRHLKPLQFPCIPNKLYGLILCCLHENPNSRMTLDELEDELSSIIQDEPPLSPGMKGIITPHGREKQRRYPYLLKEQKDRCKKEDFEPEMGIPQCIISQTSTVPYVNLRISRRIPKTVLPITEEDLISDDQPQIQWKAMVHVSEPVQDGFVLYNDDLKNISGVLKLDIKMETNGDKIMKYTYPNGHTLLNLVLGREYGTNIDKYTEILLNIAKCVERFHSSGWLVRCVTARDICVTEDKKICFLRLGRTAPLPDPNEDWLFEDALYKDRFNWLPLEVIRDKTYSRKSDVYMVAMTAYEMFAALDLHIPNPVKNQLGCIPFAVHRKRMIEDVLSCDEVPERPNSCPEWLYEILRKCWYREKIRRLTITELISQIEERWPLHRKMNDEKFTQASTNHDQEGLQSPPDVPERRFHQRALFRSFGGRMSLAPLPLPCSSSYDGAESVSGILSVSDFRQFTHGSSDSSSENYPDETYYSDVLPIERHITGFQRDVNITFQNTECSSLSTDQELSDRDLPVRMRTKRGRYKQRDEPSVKFDSEIGKHSLNQNDTREIERLERSSQLLSQHQLMDTSSSSMSSQKEVPIEFENNSESETSSNSNTIHNNSDSFIFHAQNCTSSGESTYEVGTHNQIGRSERMQINNAGDGSLEEQNDGYLKVIR